MNSNWSAFKFLCRIIGGQDKHALSTALQIRVLQQLVEMATCEDILPALAMRIEEEPELKQALDETAQQLLDQALRDNTHQNMQTLMQALKLARTLNNAGITPTFLKGTAQLLTVNNARLGFRKQLDIDLVLAPEDLKTACQALLAAGYGFYRVASKARGEPGEFLDIEEAFSTSAVHHHLPSLVMEGYASHVELHRHFLPKRFQHRIPLEPLLDSASQHQSHGATFLVPSAEYQIIHTVLGKLVHDGYLARREFPIREGCDYIELLKQTEEQIDLALVERHCGENYLVFSGLVTALMAYRDQAMSSRTIDISRRLKLMEKRYNSNLMAQRLDAYARVTHLGHQMLYSPAKLPAFLKRLVNC
jgi:hypothetical protein